MILINSSPSEIRLESIKKKLAHRSLCLQNCYDANGVIIDTKYGLDLTLLEISGAFGVCSNTKKNTDHIKIAYGLLAMLYNIAYKYCFVDLDLFKALEKYFVHAAGDRIRL